MISFFEKCVKYGLLVSIVSKDDVDEELVHNLETYKFSIKKMGKIYI